MAESTLNRLIRAIPPIFAPQTNPVWNAILQALAQEHDTLATQIGNAKAQLFVKTAEGQFLDRLGSGLGVARPATLGMLDADYQNLIPVLSTEAKNIRKVFYDAMDIFWGPLFSRTNLTTANAAPFAVQPGDELSVIVDGGAPQTLKATTQDMAVPGAMTAQEAVTMLQRVVGTTAQVITNSSTGSQYVNLRTNTPGGRGWLQFVPSTMLSSTKLNFDTSKKYRITDLTQRTALWELQGREIIIELPAVIPTLRRTLYGSHHLHLDATLQPPVPPANGIWAGSFMYSRSGLANFTASKVSAVTQEQILANSVAPKVTVNNASAFPDAPGLCIFGWGTNNQEEPVRYIGRPNNSTLLLDPTHTFAQTHPVGTYINILSNLQPPTPRTTGQDLGVYLSSPSEARAIVQALLQTLAAAGVVLTFVVLLPSYPYLRTNPYAGT